MTETIALSSCFEIVYDNLLKLIKYRNATITATNAKDKIFQTYEITGYIKINTVRNNGALIGSYFILHPNSKYINSAPLLTNLLPQEGEALVIFPTNNIGSNMERITKTLTAHIQLCKIGLFLVELPKCSQVMPHSIATPEEIKNCLTFNYMNIEQLPKIKCNDPPVIWIGGKPGDVIKIQRCSENSGEMTIYRLCIN